MSDVFAAVTLPASPPGADAPPAAPPGASPVSSAKSRCAVSSCSPTKWRLRVTHLSARHTASRLIRTRARSPRCPKSTTIHFPQRKTSASAGWANRRSLCLEMKSSEAAQRPATPPSGEWPCPAFQAAMPQQSRRGRPESLVLIPPRPPGAFAGAMIRPREMRPEPIGARADK
jgi:hypothetical protein